LPPRTCLESGRVGRSSFWSTAEPSTMREGRVWRATRRLVVSAPARPRSHCPAASQGIASTCSVGHCPERRAQVLLLRLGGGSCGSSFRAPGGRLSSLLGVLLLRAGRRLRFRHVVTWPVLSASCETAA